MRKNYPVSDIQYLLDEKAKLMSVTTTDSHITYANNDFIHASGYTFDELLCQPHNIVRHPDMPPDAFADMWTTLNAGRIWTGMVKNRRKNGDYYWVKASTTPLMKEGKVTGYMSVRTQVSQQEIQQAATLYHKINENKLKHQRLYQGLLIYKGPLKFLSLFKIIPVRWRIRSYIYFFILFTLSILLTLFPWSLPVLMFALAISGGALITGELLVMHLAKPLEKILHQAVNSASGQADNNFQLDRVDEVGMLLRAVNQSGMNFRTFVDDVNSKLAELNCACREIAAGNHTLSQRCDDTAQSLQNTASSMEQLTATIKSNASASQLATRCAEDANVAVEAGDCAVNQVTDTMVAMTRSSKEITDIINVLNNLSFQTNILALNAAVEAAHAGEQGKSFAVVASEVRILAQRSAQAAKDIATIIETTIDNINTSDKLVNHTSESMNNILTQVQQVTQLVNQISLATHEQSQGLGQINDAVNNIDELTRQNTILASHSSAAISSLEQQINTMSEAVSVFSIPR
ncbi:methyl-accepting chemotaxis protein [Brenneria izbisi]|uniref:Methyl-accepting chemotaxis protein n=1 Tax=Brenneria izbisi TaxID=2939450 RepID=A0AA41XTN9_9GAMM|nr:PAS domain-containing methyl-accepting chemotaxis protein [Brenneria izbisi]MCV9877578.1 methyl-accepting chemotaxis protein [Brenneria izbisi]MCV9880857.1 methyl-accepting chemotaxis protein [Brenneria izbisi]